MEIKEYFSTKYQAHWLEEIRPKRLERRSVSL